MDWGRRPYTTVVRPFSDSEETALIHWRPAAKGARCYPDWHAFQSRDWARDFPELTGVGEVYGEPRNYNGRAAIPGLLGLTPCGPQEWFERGQPFDPDAPPCERDENGIPDCCPYDHTGTGGAAGGSTSITGGSPLPPPPPPPPPPPIPPPPPPPPPLPPPCHEFQTSCESAVTTANDSICPMISDTSSPRWGRYNTQIGVGYGFFISSRPGAYGAWQLFTGTGCHDLISLGGGTNAGGPYNLSFHATHTQVWFVYTSIDEPLYTPSAGLTTANGTLCISAWILEVNVWQTYTYFETIHRVWFVVPELIGGTEYQILWTQDGIPADGVKVWRGETCSALYEVEYTHRAIGETRFIPPDTDRYWITIDKPTGGHLEYFIIIAVYAP